MPRKKAAVVPTTDQPSAKMGRPPKEFNWELIADYCAILCTQAEICRLLRTTDKTLDLASKRVNNEPFSEFYKTHSEDGRMSLRRAQMKSAMGGNAALLIWLGKQYLGQVDRREIETTNHTTLADQNEDQRAVMIKLAERAKEWRRNAALHAADTL